MPEGHPGARGTMQGYSWWGAERDIGWRRRVGTRGHAPAAAPPRRCAPHRRPKFRTRRVRGTLVSGVHRPTRWVSADEAQRNGPTGRRLRMTAGLWGWWAAALHRSDTLRHAGTQRTQRVAKQTDGGSGSAPTVCAAHVGNSGGHGSSLRRVRRPLAACPPNGWGTAERG